MTTRRKNAELKQKSIWDEHLIGPLYPLVKHRNKLWHYLIAHCKPDHCDNSKDKKRVLTMDDIPFREWMLPVEASRIITQEFSLFTTTVVEKKESIRGDTTKLIVRLQDGHEVETVVIRHKGHATVCVSSQIGCQMGCRFCATGTMGIIGDLTAGEIVEQLVHANAVTRIRNVVFMGMGEPLNNFENVKKAVEFMADVERFGLSPRHVTVSTVGVLRNMYRLSDELPHVNLALSLHAPNQEVRSLIVPAARAYHIDKLIEAIDYHIVKNAMQPMTREGLEMAEKKGALSQGALMFSAINQDGEEAEAVEAVDKPGRRGRISGVMIEYILIRDVNDKDEHAHELAALLKPRRENILLNLIPYNPTEVAEDYKPPFPEQVDSFYKICSGAPYGIYTRVRQEKGQDIAGACGQLALVRGQNTQGEHPDLEDTGKTRSNKSTSSSRKKGASSPSSSSSSSAKDKVANQSSVGQTAMGSLEDVLRSYAVYSFHPVDEDEDNNEWKYKAQRCRLLMLSTLLIPVGLLARDFFTKKHS